MTGRRLPSWGLYTILATSALLLLVVGATLRPLVLPSTSEGVTLSDSEIGFVQDMSVHHQQALFLTYRLSDEAAPDVRTIADRIVTTQLSEIGTMQGWLTLLDVPLVGTAPMAWMPRGPSSGHGGHAQMASGNPTEAMPGMATWNEIDHLAALTGIDAEVTFLQLMIRHHRGGIDMALGAAGTMQPGPVQRLADSMIVDQTQEVGLLTMLLHQRGAEPLPYP